MANTNAKTELNTFCQRHLKVPIGKADIVYTLQTFGEQHQATVTLNCMGGLQFSGEVAADLKQAQQNAAAAALSHHAAEIAALPAVTGKKRKAEEAAAGAPRAAKAPKAAVVAVANPSITNKSTLNAAMGRILRRPLTKDDCKYETAKIGEGFQTTVSLPGLQGQWSQLAWAGELGETEKQAQENAAAHAVAALQADPTYGPMTLVAAKPAGAKQPGAKKGRVVQMSGGVSAAGVIRPNAAMKGSGNQQAWGKAMGKGKMMGNMGKDNMNTMSQGWGSGCGMGGMAMGNQMMAKGKGKGKDKGKAPRQPMGDLPRQRVSDMPMSGVLAEWKGSFGWIEMSEQVAHQAAGKNRGRVYLHKKDWEAMTAPAQGTGVMFYLYADSSGLGADSCQPVG